jgi:hypothetical protein
MKALPPDAVKCNDKIVPSWVRLERPKQRNDLGREILTASPYGVLELSGVVRNGKVNKLRPGQIADDGNAIGRLVESRPQRFDSLIGNVGQSVGKFSPQLDLVRLAHAVRVRLNHANIGIFFEEGLDPLIQCKNVMLCSTEPLFRATERITSHGARSHRKGSAVG